MKTISIVVREDLFNVVYQVLQSKDEWLIQFMAPWCGHCQKLKPEWEEAAKKLAGDYKFGIVDATQESSLGQRYDVKVSNIPPRNRSL
jgi:thioredoxin-like negative regulator of GroEL